MKILNTGKFELLNIKVFKYRIQLNYFITEDCSPRLREKGILTFYLWEDFKIIYKKEIDFIKLIDK